MLFNSKHSDYRPNRRRQFSWLVFGVGLSVILVWNLFQPATLEMFRNWFSTERQAPEYANRMEDFTRKERLFQGLTPEILDCVKDNAPVKAAETRVAMKIWNQLNAEEIQTLKKESLGRVLFAQYFNQPRAYRGTLLRIKGTIRLIVPKNLPDRLKKGTEASKIDGEPDFGYDFSHFYELWIQPDDNPRDPILVNALQIPEELPLNENIRVPVVIDGVFFKLYLYEAEEGMLCTPMFYAKAPLWTRPLSKTAVSAASGNSAVLNPKYSALLITGGALLLAGVILLFVNRRTRPKPQEPLPDKIELP